MLQWLLTLLGLSRSPAPMGPTAPRAPSVRPDAPPGSPAPEPGRSFSPEALEFLSGIATPCELLDLQVLPADDRAFLSGILRRIRENRLDIPVLPRAALEISRLLANPDGNLTDFVRILNDDPALSVDVLRIASSAYYGFPSPAKSIREALMRIGVGQLRALLVVSHLKGKVLRGGTLAREAAWLSELSSALAGLGRTLSDHLSLSADEAFTKGLLYHVEHFVILGTASEVSKEHQRHIRPSVACLRDAFWRLGPKVRTLAARAWALDDLLTDGVDEEAVEKRYGELRGALVASWNGQQVTCPEGIPEASLEAALAACSRAREADVGKELPGGAC